MSTRRVLATAAFVGIATVSLAACAGAPDESPSASSTPSPTVTASAVPTFDPAQDWYGMTSPVLIWSDEQRDAYLESISDEVSAAMENEGLTGDEDPFEIAAALEGVLTRPAQELLLLDSVELSFEVDSYRTVLESILLDKAWETCQQLLDGADYAELADAAAASAGIEPGDIDEPIADVGRANAVGTILAPILCPAFADDGLDWVYGE